MFSITGCRAHQVQVRGVDHSSVEKTNLSYANSRLRLTPIFRRWWIGERPYEVVHVKWSTTQREHALPRATILPLPTVSLLILQ